MPGVYTHRVIIVNYKLIMPTYKRIMHNLW